MVSCSTDDSHFQIDGRLLHLNQGEFYVYTPDGDNGKLDTIKVEAGRFSYEVPCRRPMTLMIIFPNFTEQPVFAEPGKTVEIRGSASNLKEMEVKGTDDNKLMTNSGADVPKATMVKPITKSEIRNFFATAAEPSVNALAPIRISANPPIKQIKSNMYFILNYTLSYSYQTGPGLLPITK